MILATSSGVPIRGELVGNYIGSLVNLFFKILPIRENEQGTLDTYVRSLQIELMGCSSLISALHADGRILTLLSILQYFIDHPDCPVHDVRREVFKAIRVCEQLKDAYATPDADQNGG